MAEGDECVVCFEKTDTFVLPCEHLLCVKCASLWFSRTTLCPTCKQIPVALASTTPFAWVPYREFAAEPSHSHCLKHSGLASTLMQSYHVRADDWKSFTLPWPQPSDYVQLNNGTLLRAKRQLQDVHASQDQKNVLIDSFAPCGITITSNAVGVKVLGVDPKDIAAQSGIKAGNTILQVNGINVHDHKTTVRMIERAREHHIPYTLGIKHTPKKRRLPWDIPCLTTLRQQNT